MYKGEETYPDEWRKTMTSKARYDNKEIAPIYSSLILSLENDDAVVADWTYRTVFSENIGRRTKKAFRGAHFACINSLDSSELDLREVLGL